MKQKHLTFAFEIKAVEDDGTFSGYLSVFDNLDAYGEVVKQGAFKKTLAAWKKKKSLPPILWQHQSWEPIGVYTEMREDDHGLYVEGQLLVGEVQRAREAHALLKAKAISGMSIGFVTKKEREQEGVRQLLEVDLWEGSIVTFPANDAARVTDVRSALLVDGELPDLPTFEKFLREAGFSKSQATAIAGRGLSHLLRSESEGEAIDTSKALETIKSITLRK